MLIFMSSVFALVLVPLRRYASQARPCAPLPHAFTHAQLESHHDCSDRHSRIGEVLVWPAVQYFLSGPKLSDFAYFSRSCSEWRRRSDARPLRQPRSPCQRKNVCGACASPSRSNHQAAMGALLWTMCASSSTTYTSASANEDDYFMHLLGTGRLKARVPKRGGSR